MVWLLYWAFILLCVLVSMATLIKKDYVLGLSNLILSLFTPGYAFFRYMDKTNGVNEIEYFFEQLKSANLEAYFILFLFLVLLLITAYNLITNNIEFNSGNKKRIKPQTKRAVKAK